MILGIIIILLIGGITYWHYSQGFFSATFSAVSAVLAAVLAVSYHEPIVTGLLKGKMADYATAMVLVALFAGLYILLRTVFDNLIPGNARLPVYLDRVGGAAMGLVAAMFAAGIFALAAQAMPFGPSVGGYSRYELEDREVQVMVTGGRTMSDVMIDGQLKEDRFDPASKQKLWIPVDDIVLATVEKLSNGGSMAGSQSLSSVHPDLADELFAQRLGIQVGAKRTAVNLAGQKPQVSLPEGAAAFEFTGDVTKAQIDAELPNLHQRPVSLKKDAREFPLVVRVMFERNAADQDGMVRVSPASVRLVAKGKNYWPVGTVERGNTVYVNKVDDPLIIDVKNKDRGADFLFFVDPDDVVEGDPKAPKDRKVADGVFVEVKRLAKLDLGGQEIKASVTRSPNVEVMRKADVVAKDKKAPSKTPGEGGGEEKPAVNPAAAPISIQSVSVSDKLFTPVNAGSGEASLNNAQLKSGTVSVNDKRFTKMKIEPTESLRIMSEGSFAYDTLFVPDKFKMVQVKGAPPEEGGDAWGWADNLAKFQLVDANNKSYRPAGAWAQVKDSQTDRLAASYDSTGTQIPSLSRSEGRPTDVYIAFLVPAGTQLKHVAYGGQVVHETSETAQ